MGSFASKVQRGKISSPFYQSFQQSRWAEDFRKEGPADDHDLGVYESGLIFHKKLEKFWKLVANLNHDGVDPSRLRRALVASIHREYIVLSEKNQEGLRQITRDNVFVAEEFASSKISLPGLNNEASIDDLLCSAVDGIALFIRKSFNQFPGVGSSPHINQIKPALALGPLHNILISIWEDCCFGLSTVDASTSEVTIRAVQERNAASYAVSHSRYFARISEMMLLSQMHWLEVIPHIRKKGYLNLIEVNVDGYGRKTKFSFVPRENLLEHPPQSLILRICGSEEYFEEILTLPLPKINGLTLNQLLDLWQIFYSAIEALRERLPNETAPKTITELDQFAPIIPRNSLINLLNSASGIDRKLCQIALDLWTFQKETADDIWARPLIEYDKSHIVPLIPCVLHGSPLRLIERWMKFGGVDLGARGVGFECICRTEIGQKIKSNMMLQRSGFLSHAFRFSGFLDDPGDIDIVFWIGDTVFLGEIKCNLYPTRASEKYWCYNDLEKGVEQITRKAGVIIGEKQLFLDSIKLTNINKDYRVVPFVLSNLPFWVGECINDVPITDRHIIERFIGEGYFDKSRLAVNKKELSGGYRMYFYDDEIEAETRLENYLKCPPQLWHFWDGVCESKMNLPALDINDKKWIHNSFNVKISGDQHLGRTSEPSVNGRFAYRTEPL